jgi:hypothetical protein
MASGGPRHAIKFSELPEADPDGPLLLEVPGIGESTQGKQQNFAAALRDQIRDRQGQTAAAAKKRERALLA